MFFEVAPNCMKAIFHHRNSHPGRPDFTFMGRHHFLTGINIQDYLFGRRSAGMQRGGGVRSRSFFRRRSSILSALLSTIDLTSPDCWADYCTAPQATRTLQHRSGCVPNPLAESPSQLHSRNHSLSLHAGEVCNVHCVPRALVRAFHGL